MAKDVRIWVEEFNTILSFSRKLPVIYRIFGKEYKAFEKIFSKREMKMGL